MEQDTFNVAEQSTQFLDVIYRPDEKGKHATILRVYMSTLSLNIVVSGEAGFPEMRSNFSRLTAESLSAKLALSRTLRPRWAIGGALSGSSILEPFAQRPLSEAQIMAECEGKIDFGIRSHGSRGSVRMLIGNTGDLPIELQGIRAKQTSLSLYYLGTAEKVIVVFLKECEFRKANYIFPFRFFFAKYA